MEILPKTLSIAGAALYTGMSQAAIRERIKDGTLETALVGRHRIVFRDSLDKFLDASRTNKFVAQPVPWNDPEGKLTPGGRYQPKSKRAATAS